MRKRRTVRMAAAVMLMVMAGGAMDPIPVHGQLAFENRTGDSALEGHENASLEKTEAAKKARRKATASDAEPDRTGDSALEDNENASLEKTEAVEEERKKATASDAEPDRTENSVDDTYNQTDSNAMEPGDLLGDGPIEGSTPAEEPQKAAQALLETVLSDGDTFEADGLTYQVLSAEDLTVQVGDGTQANKTVSGALNIPQSVEYEGVSYEVKAIGDYAFFKNGGVTALTLPEGLERIGASAFADLKISEIVIPDSVEEMGESAFLGSTISKATVGSGLKELPRECFHMCTSLIRVAFSDGLTSIGERAFNSCSSLVTVALPASVEEIGKEAFWGCDALSGVTLSQDSALTSIGSGAFQFDENLKEITLPAGLEVIGDNAFANCSALKEIGLDESSQLVSLGGSAFSGTQITKFYIPETMTAMGDRPFHGCLKLTAIDVAGENTLWTSEDGVLYNKDKTELIQYPARKKGDIFTTPDSVTVVNKYAFYGSSYLETIRISEGVESVGEFAFQDAGKLETVDMADSVTSIGRLAFYKCPSLVTIDLSAGITSLPDNLIYGCESLEEIVLPEGIREIGRSVISNCEGLTKITLLSPQLDSVADGAFSGLDGVSFQVQNDSVKEALTAKGVSADSITSEGLTPPAELDESFTSDGIYYQVIQQPSGSKPGTVQVGNGGFDSSSVSYGQDLIIPETVENQGVSYTVAAISDNAFSTMMGGTSSLGTVTIPKTVTSIGNSAFYENSSLTQVTFADGISLDSIGDNAFDSCVALKTIATSESFQIQSVGEKAFFGCKNLTDFSLQGLVNLGSGAFSGCQSLRGVSLPATLETMGDRPFDGCVKLARVDVEDGNAAYYSVDGVLFQAKDSSLLLYPAAREGAKYTTPEGTKAIGSYGFANTSNLETIIIGDGVETVGANAFQKTAAESISLADSVTGIERLAFYNCENLSEVKLPKKLQILVTNTFYNCPSLKELTLPSGLSEIQNGALSSVPFLASVTLESKLDGLRIADGAFGGLEDTIFTVRTEAVREILAKSGVADDHIRVEETADVDPSADFSVNGMYYKVLAAPDESGNGGMVQVGDGESALPVSGRVEIPASVENGGFTYAVTALGRHAFSNAAGLTELILPEGLTSIGEAAVTESGVTEITIPKSVTSLGINALAGNRKLLTIRFEENGSLTSLGNGALSDNTVLTSIEQIPKTLESMGVAAMGWNYALTSVTFESGSSLKALGANTFFRAESLTNVILPSSIETIGDDAFYNCLKLSELRFEDQAQAEAGTDLSRLTSIGENAFYHCGSLTGFLKLGEGLEEIPGGAFAGTGFTEVTLEEGTKSLGVLAGDGEDVPVGAFEGCGELRKISLPESLTLIGKNSFKDCSSLSGVEILAKAGVRMGANAFLNAGADAIYRVYSSDTAALLEDASLISRERIADASGLLAALTQAGTYAEKDYTAESFGVLAARIREGEEILSELSSTQDSLDQKVQALNEAIKGLVKQGTEQEKVQVGFSLSGSTVVTPGQTLPFFLTMTDMNRTAAAEITFEVDQADFVKNGQVTGLNGFSVLDGKTTWKEENGKLTGHVVLSYLNGEVQKGFSGNGAVPVGRLSFLDNGKLGTVTVRVTSVRIAGYDAEGRAVDQTPVTGALEASTQIASLYDVNRDGRVDLLDIVTAQRWYQTVESSAEWVSAASCDVTADGVIDIEDLVAILNHYTL